MSAGEPAFGAAARFWLQLGWINFGGPAGQIALMHRELVERRRWIDEPRFLHALNFCMLLPGPEAMQLAVYIGWLLHGTRGAIVAGIGFCLPGVLILLGLSYLYVSYGELPVVAGVLAGFKPVVVAIVLLALVTIARRALRGPEVSALALAAFVCIHFLDISFPVIVLTAALIGGAWARTRWRTRLVGTMPEAATDSGAAAGLRTRTKAATLRLLAIWTALTAVPVATLAAIGGNASLASVYSFFTRAAYVTFGGAYAVLAYVNQAAVEDSGWLSARQAVDGFALAETTPGPLIIVLQFVGFLAAWNHPGDWSPLAAAAGAALLTSYATFLPSFFFILVGAPYVEQLRGKAWLTGALTTVTAAVVGVILNLGVVFATAVLWPTRSGVNVFAVVLTLVAAFASWKKVNVVWIILAGGVLGLVASFAGLVV